MNKLGFTERQVGHMTYRKWALLYKAYKNNFDIELVMKNKGVRYADLEKEITIDDVIPY
jgi:hypothetical protein